MRFIVVAVNAASRDVRVDDFGRFLWTKLLICFNFLEELLDDMLWNNGSIASVEGTWRDCHWVAKRCCWGDHFGVELIWWVGAGRVLFRGRHFRLNPFRELPTVLQHLHTVSQNFVMMMMTIGCVVDAGSLFISDVCRLLCDDSLNGSFDCFEVVYDASQISFRCWLARILEDWNGSVETSNDGFIEEWKERCLFWILKLSMKSKVVNDFSRNLMSLTHPNTFKIHDEIWSELRSDLKNSFNADLLSAVEAISDKKFKVLFITQQDEKRNE